MDDALCYLLFLLLFTPAVLLYLAAVGATRRAAFGSQSFMLLWFSPGSVWTATFKEGERSDRHAS